MEAIRDALQEVEANCTELYHLRTKGLKEGAFAKQEEWRRAKLDFSARKLTLIDKETKKRMLEDVWQDRIELEESELQQSDAECKSKKERVKELKEANRLQRLKLREQAEQVEGSITELRSQTTALTSQLKEVEKAQSVADRRKRAEAELVDKIGRTKARLEAADKAIVEAEADTAALEAKLEALHAEAAAVEQQRQQGAHEAAQIEAQLSRVQAQEDDKQAREGQKSAWYEQVTSVMERLSGLKPSALPGGVLRYELNRGHSLYFEFDKLSGRLNRAALTSPDGSPFSPPELAPIVEQGLKINSIALVVREVQQMLIEMGHPFEDPPTEGHPGGPPRPLALTSVTSVPSSAVPATPIANLNQRLSMAAAAPATGGPQTAADRLHRVREAMDTVRSQGVPTPSLDRPVSAFAPTPPPAGAPPPTGAPPPWQQEVPQSTPEAAPPPADVDTVPRAEYAGASSRVEPPSTSAAPDTIGRVQPIDQECLSQLSAARHERQRRKSRKSFSRAVLHARSPCERAANAGLSVDPRVALSGFASAGGGEAGAGVLFRILDPLGAPRATLLADGTFVGAGGKTLGYWEPDGSCGNAELEYLGEVSKAVAGTSVGYVTGREDEQGRDQLLAEVDYGRALIREPSGSTLAEVSRSGEVLGHWGATCGKLEGFNYEMIQQAAAYILLIDPEFVKGK